MNQSFSWEAFNSIPVVGILRNMPRQQIERLPALYLEAGLSTLEVTMNSEKAAGTIGALVKSWGDQLNIGAGTVCTLEELHIALDAGAQFIVTPIVNEEIIKQCVDRELPVFAGAYTPTEIYRAWHCGASMVKVFPASQLGPAYIKEVLAPLNQIKLLPTGGVTVDNFTDFLKAGASGLGMGSHLIPKHLLENRKWEELSAFWADFMKRYQEFLKEKN